MDDSKLSNAIPSWQQQRKSHDETALESTNSHSQSADETDVILDQARKFLRHEDVLRSSVEKKTEFLRSKGLNETQIQKLLREPINDDDDDDDGDSITYSNSDGNGNLEKSSLSSLSTRDSPPIITYPEFLTTTPRPPSLITPSRLANILAVSGSIWTILYGAAQFVVSPMVDTLTESRTEYLDHVNEKMEQFVEKLEGVVSEVPYKNNKLLRSGEGGDDDDDAESTFSDPTELFHRDFGTQTSSPVLRPDDLNSASGNQSGKVIDAQVRRLAAVRASLREMNDMHIRRAEDSTNLNAILREVRDEIDKLGAPPLADFTSIHSGLGYGRSAEPDDEVKKTKDAIRSVKGMFLSTRRFPASAAR